VADPTPTRAVEEARALLSAAKRVLVLTGAGVSAESGVPTFRDAGALWKRYRAEDLATPAAFHRDPRLVWEWYAMRRGLVAACAPNAAHRALADWILARPGGRVLATQNVDGLHERALADADVPGPLPDAALPLTLHGSLDRARCTRCAYRGAPDRSIDTRSVETLPRCPHCGALLRPDVVWFGEALDPAVLDEAFSVAGAADVCLVVGTSARVHPAAALPDVTRAGGGVVLEVNPEATPVSSLALHSLRGTAADLVPRLLVSDA
jgi:NAD-dependent deacetylase